MFAGWFDNFGLTTVKAIIFLHNFRENKIYPPSPFNQVASYARLVKYLTMLGLWSS